MGRGSKIALYFSGKIKVTFRNPIIHRRTDRDIYIIGKFRYPIFPPLQASSVARFHGFHRCGSIEVLEVSPYSAGVLFSVFCVVVRQLIQIADKIFLQSEINISLRGHAFTPPNRVRIFSEVYFGTKSACLCTSKTDEIFLPPAPSGENFLSVL